MGEIYKTTSGNGYTVPKYSEGVDGPAAFKEFADALDLEHIDPINTEVTNNTSEIRTNAGEISSLSNRLNALENTTLSAEWKIRVDGAAPSAGEVSLNTDVWSTVDVLNISGKDANGVDHDFSNVKSGDTIQIGVGPDAKLAGSSAAYTVDSVTGTEFRVTHLASTGAPELGFIAIIAVYPAFDPSNYATTAELDAVKLDKLSRGKDLVAPDAKTLEDSIKTNADAIALLENYDDTALAGRVSNNETAISNIQTEQITQNTNITTNATEIAKKFNKGDGPLDYIDATILGKAVKTNEGGISKNATIINNLAKELNLEIDTDGSITINGGGEVPNLNELEKGIEDNAIAIEDKFDLGAGTTNYNDATEMEAAIDNNTDNITTNATNIEAVVGVLGGDINDIGGIVIDSLPPQGGKDGLFLQTDGSKASWVAPKTEDILLSDDSFLFAELPTGGNVFKQSEANEYIAKNAYFRGQTITWGQLANKTV